MSNCTPSSLASSPESSLWGAESLSADSILVFGATSGNAETIEFTDFSVVYGSRESFLYRGSCPESLPAPHFRVDVTIDVSGKNLATLEAVYVSASFTLKCQADTESLASIGFFMAPSEGDWVEPDPFGSLFDCLDSWLNRLPACDLEEMVQGTNLSGPTFHPGSVKRAAADLFLVGLVTFLGFVCILDSAHGPRFWEVLPFYFTLPACGPCGNLLSQNSFEYFRCSLQAMARLSNGLERNVIDSILAFFNVWGTLFNPGPTFDTNRLVMEVIGGFAEATMERLSMLHRVRKTMLTELTQAADAETRRARFELQRQISGFLAETMDAFEAVLKEPLSQEQRRRTETLSAAAKEKVEDLLPHLRAELHSLLWTDLSCYLSKQVRQCLEEIVDRRSSVLSCLESRLTALEQAQAAAENNIPERANEERGAPCLAEVPNSAGQPDHEVHSDFQPSFVPESASSQEREVAHWWDAGGWPQD